MNFYTDFLVQNYAKKIGPLEENLKSLSFLLPGKFNHSSLISEFLYALVSSVQLLHRRIISLHFAGKNVGEFLERTSKLYRIISYLLSVIVNFQTSTEMLMNRFFHGQRLNVITLIELCKCALKIALFAIGQGKKAVPHAFLDDSFPFVLLNRTKTPEKGKYSGKVVSPPEQSIQESLPSKRNNSSPTLTSTMQQLREVVHIIQPVVYIALIRHYGLSGNGSRSWKPWIAGLGMFCFANLAHILPNFQPEEPSTIDTKEANARVKELVLFLLKEPFYSTFVKDKIDAFTAKSESFFLLKPVISLVKEYQSLFEQNFYYCNK
jgi:peroxin-16